MIDGTVTALSATATARMINFLIVFLPFLPDGVDSRR
jgi:hypothetical protein